MKCVAMALTSAVLVTTCFSDSMIPVIQVQAAEVESDEYKAFADKNGEYAFDEYDREELYVNVQLPLSYACQNLSLQSFYEQYKETNPEYFTGETDYYAHLTTFTKDKDYVCVTPEIEKDLRELSSRILGNENKWPAFCFYQKILPAKGYIEICDENGKARTDIAKAELFVNLSAPLQYCGYGYSLKSFYDVNKDTNPQYFGNNGIDYYQKIVELAGETEYVKVTPEIQSYLMELYKAFCNSEKGEDYWKLCYYYGDTTKVRDENLGKSKLIYGNENLEDKDAVVILITGDGFTRAESSKFQFEAEKFARELVNSSPYDEVANAIKIYRVKTTSVDSGIIGDNAKNAVEMISDKRSTYFGSSFWGNGEQQIVTMEDGGMKVEKLLKSYHNVDYGVVLLNSTMVGGMKGSNYAVGSISDEGRELLLNKVNQIVSGQEKIDSGIKCQETIRKALCGKSNVTQMFFQPFYEIFLEKSQPQDLSKYVILRKGSMESKPEEIANLLHVIYYDKNGTPTSQMITENSGIYKMKVVFDGNGVFDKIEKELTYHVDVVFSYDSMGGDIELDTYETVGEKVGDSLPEPTKEGYTFRGWFTEPALGVQVDENTIVTSSMKLYAHWEKSFDVNFEANGAGAIISENLVTVIDGETISELPEAKRQGYWFDGWYTTKKKGGSKLSNKTTISKNSTYYARWSKVVVPKVTNVKLKRGREALKVSYKRIARMSGYQIKYAIKKDMKVTKKVETRGSSKTLTRLKSSKVYYVKVRAYAYDSMGKKVYGQWSKMKCCKTK